MLSKVYSEKAKQKMMKERKLKRYYQKTRENKAVVKYLKKLRVQKWKEHEKLVSHNIKIQHHSELKKNEKMKIIGNVIE